MNGSQFPALPGFRLVSSEPTRAGEGVPVRVVHPDSGLRVTLAPEHPFPAGIEDAVVAAKWVVAHASELGGNGTVAVAGDSAGGNFSAVVAQQLRDAGIALAAQFLIYPAVDHVAATYPSIGGTPKATSSKQTPWPVWVLDVRERGLTFKMAWT